VQLCDVGVVSKIVGSVETKALEIQSAVVAARRIVAARILLQNTQHLRAWADAQRINLPQIRLCQRCNSSIRVPELQNPLPHIRGRYMLELADREWRNYNADTVGSEAD